MNFDCVLVYYVAIGIALAMAVAVTTYLIYDAFRGRYDCGSIEPFKNRIVRNPVPEFKMRKDLVNDLIVSDSQKYYAFMWATKLEKKLKNSNSQLTAIHDLGYVSVTVQLEDKFPKIKDTMGFVENKLGDLSKNYGLWLSKLSGKFGYPKVLDRDGNLPIKLYGISLREDRKHPDRDTEQKYGGKWKKLRYNGNNSERSPDGKESNWFEPSYDKRNPPQTLLLTYGDSGFPLLVLGFGTNNWIRMKYSSLSINLLRHEIGHTFWIDDLYSNEYPKRKDGYGLNPPDSIMYDSFFAWKGVTEMDHLMMRMAWMMKIGQPILN